MAINGYAHDRAKGHKIIEIINIDTLLDQVVFLDTETQETCTATGDFLDMVLRPSDYFHEEIGYPYTGKIRRTAMVISRTKLSEAFKCLRQ